MSAQKFPELLCRPVAAQFMENNLIALFAFESTETGVAISSEKHYRLVESDDITHDDLTMYQNRPAID